MDKNQSAFGHGIDGVLGDFTKFYIGHENGERPFLP
jgi:hypothetical protein